MVVNDELRNMRNWSQPILSYYPKIWLEVLRKTVNYFGQDSQLPDLPINNDIRMEPQPSELGTR